ncbi:MAG: hypothetical protein ACI9MR_001900 [Myxococcota bacterium]|jgi:hypothetical protein
MCTCDFVRNGISRTLQGDAQPGGHQPSPSVGKAAEKRMPLQIVTLPMNDTSVGFDDKALNEAVGTGPVEAVASHVVKVNGRPHLVLVLQESSIATAKRPNWRKMLSDDDFERFEALRHWRNEKAAQLGRAAYLLASNQMLADLARARPVDREGMLAIKGIGSGKVEAHGVEILETLAKPVDVPAAAVPADVAKGA